MFTGKIRAYDDIWFFGDNFRYRSYSEHFNDRDPQSYHGYVKVNYRVRGYFTNKFTHHDQNAVSRMRNVMANALHERTLLPKFIVIVPDDDIIRYAMNINRDAEDKDLISMLRKLLDNIMKQHDRYISTQKEYLPAKSQKGRIFPQIIWIQPPLHVNFHNNQLHSKFNKCLNEVVKYHANTTSLSLKQIWDQDDTRLYMQESRQFTNLGYNSYWAAVDRTIKFADTILIKKFLKIDEAHEKTNQRKKHFSWSKETTKGRKLPTPKCKKKSKNREDDDEDTISDGTVSSTESHISDCNTISTL